MASVVCIIAVSVAGFVSGVGAGSQGAIVRSCGLADISSVKSGSTGELTKKI